MSTYEIIINLELLFSKTTYLFENKWSNLFLMGAFQKFRSFLSSVVVERPWLSLENH